MKSPHLHIGDGPFAFDWDTARDRAVLTAAGREVWSGSLLPLFWLQRADGSRHAVGATCTGLREAGGADQVELDLALGEIGAGTFAVTLGAHGLRGTRLAVRWTATPAPAIISLHFGCRLLSRAQRAAAPSLDLPFWPGWRAEGYGLAGAKTSPMQSFFRSWDFGHADIALGSFAPAMGTPYGAAFPRPVYAGCMGGRHGWLCLGAGTVPDAALTWQVRARSGALEWRYREDLWGAPDGPERTWDNPLWLAWAPTAWAAYRNYFRMFPANPPKAATHQKTFWGTWGDFRLERYDLRGSIDRAVDTMAADLVCVDDPWEHTKGSCQPHPERLPHFAADIAHAHTRGIGVGIWMPILWLERPEPFGLDATDLLLSRDGSPVTSNWAVDPHEPQAYFCLDPSSPRAVAYLRERTRRVMRDYRPGLLKIDFGYGAPGPDACSPRDPALRGERLAWSLARIIADAARELDPAVTILGYSLHPTWDVVQDETSLDDLGDAGAHESAGHGNWSVWAALAADRGMPLMGSSGYLWSADADVVLNSAILGAPGANLPTEDATRHAAAIARRRGLFRWHRRTTAWTPQWLDSTPGDIEREPAVRSWGRLETVAGQPTLTALVLREPSAITASAPELRDVRWQGRFALIAQGDHAVLAAGDTAVIAYDEGFLAWPTGRPPSRVVAVQEGREAEFAGWTWEDGTLRLIIAAALAREPLMGFVISLDA